MAPTTTVVASSIVACLASYGGWGAWRVSVTPPSPHAENAESFQIQPLPESDDSYEDTQAIPLNQSEESADDGAAMSVYVEEIVSLAAPLSGALLASLACDAVIVYLGFLCLRRRRRKQSVLRAALGTSQKDVETDGHAKAEEGLADMVRKTSLRCSELEAEKTDLLGQLADAEKARCSADARLAELEKAICSTQRAGQIEVADLRGQLFVAEEARRLATARAVELEEVARLEEQKNKEATARAVELEEIARWAEQKTKEATARAVELEEIARLAEQKTKEAAGALEVEAALRRDIAKAAASASTELRAELGNFRAAAKEYVGQVSSHECSGSCTDEDVPCTERRSSWPASPSVGGG